ncbi:MAG: YqiA/YcfP family alpha/beta fold hydrolase [Gammaproteobacteria bacterium]
MVRAHLVYLHGLHSSPESKKAQTVMAFVRSWRPEVAIHVPQLHYDPDKNWDTLQPLMSDLRQGQNTVALIGSSMGGYYAACLGQHYVLRTALVNPVIDPQKLLSRCRDEFVHEKTGERYRFTEADAAKFVRWGTVSESACRNTLLCLGLRDEVLSPQWALERLGTCRRIIDPSGDHYFSRFSTILPEVMDFLLPVS